MCFRRKRVEILKLNRFLHILISVNVLYDTDYQDNIHQDEVSMLKANHENFLIKTFTGIHFNKDLVVLDPFDSDFQQHINNLKHGAWIGESAYFNDAFSKRSILISAEVWKCAQLLASRANTNDQYKSLVETFKRKFGRKETIQQAQAQHLDNPLVSDCFKIVADHLEPLREELTVKDSCIDFDSQMNMIFHDAVHALKAEHSQEEEDVIKGVMAEIVGEDVAKASMDVQFNEKTLPEAISRFKVAEDNRRKAIEDRFPRSVQYMRMKHVDQAEFTALDSSAWEQCGKFENSSGQLSVLGLEYVESTTAKESQLTLSKLANDIQVIDGERVNMSMVGGFEHGMNCMTPMREVYGDIWVVRENEVIVEILLHFDLAE